MRFFFLLLGCLLLYSCINKQPNIQSNGNLVLIDSLPVSEKIVNRSAKNLFAYYPVYYLGPKNDTIKLGLPISRHYYEPLHDVDSTLKNLNSISLTVDTTLNLGHIFNYEHYDTVRQQMVIDSTKIYPAYAIIIKNLSDSLLYAGHFDELSGVMQTQDKRGKWIDIEREIIHFCGTGARKIIVKPNHILIAKMIRFDGDIRVICRIKFYLFNQFKYSNTFLFSINKNQLTAKLNP